MNSASLLNAASNLWYSSTHLRNGGGVEGSSRFVNFCRFAVLTSNSDNKESRNQNKLKSKFENNIYKHLHYNR